MRGMTAVHYMRQENRGDRVRIERELADQCQPVLNVLP